MLRNLHITLSSVSPKPGRPVAYPGFFITKAIHIYPLCDLQSFHIRKRLLRFCDRKLSALIKITCQKILKTCFFTAKDTYITDQSFSPHVVGGSLRARKFSLMFF
ncbi:hypothetical protein C1N69_18380 [Enterobacter sichuanensis]|nr:hypothetical protein C1N69_18380 [Enterobacter sichuanensis]